MTTHTEFLALLIAAFILSLIGTAIFIRHARKTELLAVPTNRSSHDIPTPQGAGLVFSIITLLCWIVIGVKSSAFITYALALCIPSAIIIITGYLDDYLCLRRTTRLVIQAFCALLFIILANPDAIFAFPFLISVMLFVPVIVWLINLYNFMDGIDGIAAGYGMTVCLIAAFFIYFSGGVEQYQALLCLFATLMGFYLFNRSPARVFMGDAGSTFLGFSFGAFIFISKDTITASGWAILLAAFIADTSWTLSIRLITGQNWAQAHRLHAYQKLTPCRADHKKVTALYSLYTFFWLAPILYLKNYYQLNLILALLLSYIPIILLCWHVRAGQADKKNN